MPQETNEFGDVCLNGVDYDAARHPARLPLGWTDHRGDGEWEYRWNGCLAIDIRDNGAVCIWQHPNVYDMHAVISYHLARHDPHR